MEAIRNRTYDTRVNGLEPLVPEYDEIAQWTTIRNNDHPLTEPKV